MEMSAWLAVDLINTRYKHCMTKNETNGGKQNCTRQTTKRKPADRYTVFYIWPDIVSTSGLIDLITKRRPPESSSAHIERKTVADNERITWLRNQNGWRLDHNSFTTLYSADGRRLSFLHVCMFVMCNILSCLAILQLIYECKKNV